MTKPKASLKKRETELLMDGPVYPTKREQIEAARRVARRHSQTHEEWLLYMDALGIAEPIEMAS